MLELSSSGRFVIVVGASVLVLSFLLSSPLFLILAAFMFLYILLEGISFRRTLELTRRSVNVYTTPSEIKTIVGRRGLVETVVKNETPVSLHVVGIELNLPDVVRSKTRSVQLLLAPHQEERIETVLETEIPGRFNKTWSTVVFETRSRLFRQHVSFPDRVTMTATPMVGEARPLVETDNLHDLAVDRVRRGVGTDLVGIRPATLWDDFRRIDWKATARTGRLMTREFYLEKEPPIVLLIDVSTSMRVERIGRSILTGLLGEVARLLVSTRPSAATPVGLILFDERDVIAYVEPRSGRMNRNRILSTLIERSGLADASLPPQQEMGTPCAVLNDEIKALEIGAVSVSKEKTFHERYSTLVNLILPFYRTAASRRVTKLKQQGAFKAFQIVCRLRERVLAIAVSDAETNLDGLCEGARYAAALSHRVFIAVSPLTQSLMVIDLLAGLQRSGVRVIRCEPDELWRRLSADLLAISRTSPFRTRITE